MKKILGCAVLAMLIAAPGFAQKVTIDYAHGFDFDSVTTFQYVDTEESNIKDNPMMGDRVVSMIKQELREGARQSDAEQQRDLRQRRRHGYERQGQGGDQGADHDEIERDGLRALEAAEDFFRACLRKYPKPQRYLEDRGISTELLERYRVGYAPDEWRQLITALRERVGVKALEAAGLIARSEKRPDEPYEPGSRVE